MPHSCPDKLWCCYTPIYGLNGVPYLVKYIILVQLGVWLDIKLVLNFFLHRPNPRIYQ